MRGFGSPDGIVNGGREIGAITIGGTAVGAASTLGVAAMLGSGGKGATSIRVVGAGATSGRSEIVGAAMLNVALGFGTASGSTVNGATKGTAADTACSEGAPGASGTAAMGATLIGANGATSAVDSRASEGIFATSGSGGSDVSTRVSLTEPDGSRGESAGWLDGVDALRAG